MSESNWKCACGETNITKHDIGMSIAHEYGISEQKGRDILVRIRDRTGMVTASEDRVVSEKDTNGNP